MSYILSIGKDVLLLSRPEFPEPLRASSAQVNQELRKLRLIGIRIKPIYSGTFGLAQSALIPRSGRCRIS